MLALPDALPPRHQQQPRCVSVFAEIVCVCSYMPVHVYRQPWSSDKSGSEFVICMQVYPCVHACACVCVCVCVVPPVVLVVIREGAGGWS